MFLSWFPRATGVVGAGALLAGLLGAMTGVATPALADPAGFGAPQIAVAPWQVPGLAYDSAGDLFAVDNGAKRLVEFRSDGSLSVLATGLVDPQGVALDAAGDVFVADKDTLLELPSGGGRSTVATGLAGIDQLAVDAAGDTVYATIPNSNRLVSIDVTSGTVSTVPLTGTSRVTGVAEDSSGDVVVTDCSDTGHAYELPAGGGAQRLIGTFHYSVAVAVDDAGDVFGNDNGRILEQPAGGGAPTAISSAQSATAVAVDNTGNVAIAQRDRQNVIELPADHSAQRILAQGVWNADGLAVQPDGTLDVAGYGDYASGEGLGGGVWRATPGSIVATQVDAVDAAAGLTLDSAGDLFVGDYNDGNVVEYPAGGGPSTLVCSNPSQGAAAMATDAAGDLFITGGSFGVEVDECPPGGAAQDINDTQPSGIATDSAGNLYITNDTEVTVLAAGTLAQRSITTTGGSLVSLVVGPDDTIYGTTTSGDLESISQTGTTQVIATGLGFSTGIGFDGDGNLYVSNYDNEVLELPSLAAPEITGVSAAGGPGHGGQTVTITGHRFTAGSQVYFGNGNPATDVRVDSPDRITATTPAHVNGTVNVRVTAANGSTPVTAADHYTFRTPVVSVVATPVGPAAGGTTIVLGGGDFTNATAVTVDGTAATHVHVVNDHRITATSPAHAPGSVGVTVTGPDGTSTAATYTYQDAPSISGVSPPTGSTGGGDVVTIRGTGFTGVRAVYFSGSARAATVHVDSSTQLTVTSPAHVAGYVNVRVVTSGGASPLTVGDHYRYAS